MRFGVSTFLTDEGIRPDVLGRACEERGFESKFEAAPPGVAPESGGERTRRSEIVG